MSSVLPKHSEVKVTEMDFGFSMELELFDRMSNGSNSPKQAQDEESSTSDETKSDKEKAKVDDNSDRSGANERYSLIFSESDCELKQLANIVVEMDVYDTKECYSPKPSKDEGRFRTVETEFDKEKAEVDNTDRSGENVRNCRTR